MIYLDNAATTYPKPISVKKSICSSFQTAANPGRAGHRLSLESALRIYETRSSLANFFKAKSPENVILTPGCTFSINTVIKGILRQGDHVVISSLEHNSVLRPLEKLRSQGMISYSVADVFEKDHDKTFESFRKAIQKNTKLMVCTHASNVFGLRLPIERIAALCKYYGILFCLDASQSAGVIDINLTDNDVDYLCIPGHKGLYGPMGTGALIINTDVIPDSLCEGGTGSGSLEFSQPSMLPDKFESGTVNLSGFVGLAYGVKFVKEKTAAQILSHEMHLTQTLYDGLINNNSVILYTDRPQKEFYVPMLSFNVKDISCEDVASILDRKYGIAVRAGLHCSPLAHESFKTGDMGTVRVSPSVFTTPYQIDYLIRAVNEITVKSKKFR